LTDTRTKPRYQTFGPADGTGRTWHDYFNDLKGRTVEPVAPEPDDTDEVESLGNVIITIPGQEIPEKWFNLGAPRALLTWRNRLLANDWEFKCGASQARNETTYYKNGNVNQPAHWEEMWWINAIKDGEYVTISYNLRDGKVYSARTSRTMRSRWGLLGDKEMKELVEAEDG
jgi:hypothetical protein